MIYTGDVKIQQLDDGSHDTPFENGQPDMTNGFETFVQLPVLVTIPLVKFLLYLVFHALYRR